MTDVTANNAKLLGIRAREKGLDALEGLEVLEGLDALEGLEVLDPLEKLETLEPSRETSSMVW